MLIFQINIVENGGDRREPPRIVDPEGKYKARKIDKVSRKIFPMAFVLFNIVYWIMYTISFSTSDPYSRYVRYRAWLVISHSQSKRYGRGLYSGSANQNGMGVACTQARPITKRYMGVACNQPQPIRTGLESMGDYT